jgi:Concanavalin A-like lectin/glucanases superfamily/Phosphoesterase family
MRKYGILSVCLSLAIGLLWPASEASATASGKVVVIMMENAAYEDLVGNSQAPYLNQLAAQGQLFTRYTAVAPASNPNYLAMTSGLTSALSPPSANIFQAFDAAGSGTWKEFMESMPGNCASGTSAKVPGTTVDLYTADHDPAYAYRANTTCATNDVPMTTSTFNPANLPDFSYVVPNECNDMHTLPANGQPCPAYFGSNPGTSLINMADNWLAHVVPLLLAQPDVTVLITWDEGRGSTTPPQHILTLEVGDGIAAGTDATAYNHYGLEAGLYRFFGLGTPPNNGATATPLPIAVASGNLPPAPTNLTASPSSSSVALSWAESDPTVSYQLDRSTDPSFSTFASVSLPAGTYSYSDTNLAAGIYYYRLAAVNSGGQSGYVSASAATTSYAALVAGRAGRLADWRLGESSGSTAVDATGRFNGAYENGPVLGSSGVIARDPDTSVTFNGTNQRVTVPTLPSAGDFSLEGWTYLTNSSVNNNTVFGSGTTVRLLARPGTGATAAYAGVTLGGTEYVLQPSSAGSNLNTWVYWVMTRQGGTLTLYRNGVALAQRNDLPASATANLNGNLAAQSNGRYYLSGRLDEVALYTRALSSVDVSNGYVAALNGIPPGSSSGSSYASLVQAGPALLAYWRLGESSGTTAVDATGRYSGSYENGPVLGSSGAIAGDPNTSVTFNGTNQRVTVPTLPSAGDFSLEGWTYLTSSSVNNNTVFGGGGSGSGGTVRLLARPGTGATAAYAGVTLGGTEYVLQPNTAGSNLNTWVYWVLTRQGGTLTLYRNGVALAQRNDLPASATANLNGYLAAQSNGNYYLHGKLDEVALYTAALSAGTILNHYQAAQ